MRILIVGSGIAGSTLAALLMQQKGHEITLIEKAANFEHAGYMLSLYPIGNRVLYGLGQYDSFLKNSQVFNYYELHDGRTGKLINRYPFSSGFLDKKYGLCQTLMRGELIKILHQGLKLKDFRMGTDIDAIEQDEHEVTVTFSDGSKGVYDLVVGADGIHSKVRELAFDSEDIQYYDTGWGGWLWFTEDRNFPHDETWEYWGHEFLLGLYPVQDKIGIIAAIPNEKACLDAPHTGRKAMLEKICQFQGENLRPCVMKDIPEDDAQMFYWRLKDVRCKNWSHGRVVLLGDASTAFLPTAGVGASMAMESAAVLADELSRTDAKYVKNAIDFYIKRRQPRAEKAQTASRQIAKMMFVKSGFKTWMRNYMLKFYSLERLSKDLTKLFDQII